MNPLIQNFKDLMSRWPTGVSVITTIDETGKKYGFTANSFTSVSLDPMLVSFCLMKTSTTLAKLEKSKKFAISILNSDQEHLARHFATPLQDKFQNIAHKLSPKTGCPYLEDIVGYIECETRFQYPGGDHDIFVGEVIETFLDSQTKPLLHFNRKFSGV